GEADVGAAVVVILRRGASAAVDPGDVHGAVTRDGEIVEGVRRRGAAGVVVHVDRRLEGPAAVCRAGEAQVTRREPPPLDDGVVLPDDVHVPLGADGDLRRRLRVRGSVAR